MAKSLSIHITFLEPYRMVEWFEKSDRKDNRQYLRGQSFAQWHKNADENSGGSGRPYITGTLLRSAVIKAAEELLSLTGSEWEKVPCCNGEFETEREKPALLRKRSTLKWKTEKVCKDNTDACPFCVLLGRFDKAHKNHKLNNFIIDDYSIRFSNIDLKLKGVSLFKEPNDIASERLLNRVDYSTGKAQDYFKVWEVEDDSYWEYKGRITLADGVFGASAEKLLTDSLKFVDRLCGALCVIDIDDFSHQPSPTRGEGSFSETTAPKTCEEAVLNPSVTLKVDADNMEKLRILADAVRALRLKDPDTLELPKGKENDKHFMWDKVKINGNPVRDLIKGKIDEFSKETNKDNRKRKWRDFCENLGQELYEKSKAGGISQKERMLGDTEYYPDIGQKKVGPVTFIDSSKDVKEWIFVGRLKAETPFYFGTETSSGAHTSLQVLLDKKTGKYRLPRSVQRGVLRRDLRFAFGTGCNVELGKERPCACEVCMVMRSITVMDAKSDFCEPPEIRHRIRMNPYTSTVDEGALFDIEVGPEGISFPFILRYRGSELPDELTHVLFAWIQGDVFFGGSASTGKGRFSLQDLKYYEWDLKQKLEKYINEHGFRGKKLEDLKDAMHGEGFKLSEIASAANKPQWTKVAYEINIESPLLTNDPIGALLDKDNHDAIAYQKRVWENGKIEERYTYKSESIRGILRTAFGSVHEQDGKGLLELDHEDCTCSLCKIFGNEHEAGRIRFEDLEIENPEPKHFDHVAIDRFTSGAADKKKFDDYSLAGSPNKPLKLTGRFWLKHDILEADKNKLKKALCDIRDGFYPLGAKGGIGYGWIKELQIMPNSAGINLSPKSLAPVTLSDYQFLKLTELKLQKNAVYYPHYFLKPDGKVNREIKLTGHEKFHKERLSGKISGKITCKLKTLTPLIVPDTENVKEDNKHKTYSFFRINEEVIIPGSEIRGMVSSVYEALTNSCFRVMEEERYLSSRLIPRSGYVPGIVRKKNGTLCIVETQTVRLPLYDDKNTTDKITFKLFEKKCENKDHGKNTEAVIKKNKNMAIWAEENRLYILDKTDKDDILLGRQEIRFNFANKENDADKMALLDDNGERSGYIKFTGLNMVNQGKTTRNNIGYKDGWDVKSLELLLDTRPDSQNDFILNKFLRKAPQGPKGREKQPYKYPRPFLMFSKDGKQYTIYKRCERVFLEPEKDSACYTVPKKVTNRYRDMIKDYKNNYGRIDKKFLTIFQHDELQDGDLVYFLYNKNGEVNSVIPVPISRTSYNNPLGKMLSDTLRPCEREWLDDFDTSLLDNFADKHLFRRHPDGLCPACRLFGTTHYKGRVRFGFAHLNETEPKLTDVTLPLLERPRPTWSMPDDKATVPGRKFYIHHNGWDQVIKDNKKNIISKTENNRTVQRLAEDNEFTFEVFFENLEEWELGLLIYSLELEKGLAHKLGMGKALGFGSVKIDVDNISLRNQSAQTNYREEGFKKLNTWFGNNADHIEDLKKLLRYQNDRNIIVHYPKLKKESPSDAPLGYVELKKDNKNSRGYLTIPWKPWHDR